jgi:hypothetical protein
MKTIGSLTVGLMVQMISFSLMMIEAGLPDFSWYMIPKPEKMYQMNTKCTKWQ